MGSYVTGSRVSSPAGPHHPCLLPTAPIFPSWPLIHRATGLGGSDPAVQPSLHPSSWLASCPHRVVVVYNFRHIHAQARKGSVELAHLLRGHFCCVGCGEEQGGVVERVVLGKAGVGDGSLGG